ncbi:MULTISPECIES: sulfatase-like hydrolase/transferase [unclassified Pseudomonas]|uniref:sulfatase-like hydrolase/transferase n=1 Tax=unclassified Pseudomonas TaxID=196821 RepID=UPI002447C7CA|nr:MULTISPECIES: sulfatase-like hydrolase/transferase [unclassified Pseudomonas]MDH0896646.1 sulfatase-like hydrolase/transferase [Pseudomonas sp. GD03875]MDH1066413.1 sulfatase-like hydrolase/transferase [Pseudomonas sp. GD03985]
MSYPVLINVVLSLALLLLLIFSRRPLWPKSILVALFLLVAGAWWGANRFTDSGFDLSVLYHLQTGVKGAGYSEYLPELLIVCTSLAAVLIALTLPLWRRAWGFVPSSLFVVAYGLSLWLAPGPGSLYSLMKEYGSLAGSVEDKAQEYRTPAGTLKRPRNVVYIYAESLERTYLDEERFPELMLNIKRLSSEALDFSGIAQLPGTGWTIAGMVSSQCGVPLSMPVSQGNTMAGRSSFLSGATCLGDFLVGQGYRAAFYGGADSSFAGKHGFLTQHGFDKVVGLEYFSTLPELAAEDMSAWGVKDDVLLDHAYKAYEALSADSAPFLLSLLTLDTHHPSGHMSASCSGLHYAHSDLPMLQAVHCSDHLLGSFVDKIRRSPWGADTVVVLASDHLAMVNDAQTLLQGNGEPRKNLFLIFDPGRAPGVIETKGAVLDEGATVLDVLGASEPALGFGRSLLGTGSDDGMSQAHARKDPLGGYMSFARGLWLAPSIDQGVTVEGDQLRIGEETTTLPLLVSLEDGGRIREFYLNNPLGSFMSLPPERYYLYVDLCEVQGRPGDGYCMLYGKKGVWNIPFSQEDLLQTVVPTEPQHLRRREVWNGPAWHVAMRDQLQVLSGGFPHPSKVIRGQEQAVPERGLTVYDLSAEGEFLAATRYDTCADTVEEPTVTVSGRYRLVVSADSALCEDRGLLEKLGLELGSEVISALQFRQPYMGIFDRQEGRWLVELSGEKETVLHRFFSLSGHQLVRPCELLGRCGRELGALQR